MKAILFITRLGIYLGSGQAALGCCGQTHDVRPALAVGHLSVQVIEQDLINTLVKGSLMLYFNLLGEGKLI